LSAAGTQVLPEPQVWHSPQLPQFRLPPQPSEAVPQVCPAGHVVAGTHIVVVVVVLVEVVVVVVVVVLDVVVGVVEVVVVVALGFFSDGTHSSRRWISSGWAGPNWLFVNVCTVPKAKFFVL